MEEINKKLLDLRRRWKEEPEKREVIEMQAKILKMALKKAEEKNPIEWAKNNF